MGARILRVLITHSRGIQMRVDWMIWILSLIVSDLQIIRIWDIILEVLMGMERVFHLEVMNDEIRIVEMEFVTKDIWIIVATECKINTICLSLDLLCYSILKPFFPIVVGQK